MTSEKGPRPRPCPSCPYRKDVPSGVWDAEEYERLKNYDGDIPAQLDAGAFNLFGCHQADGHLCSGWLAHRDASELLSVRVAIADGRFNPEWLDYTTKVPLFESGAEAAEHGESDIDDPGEKAQAVISKIVRKRDLEER